MIFILLTTDKQNLSNRSAKMSIPGSDLVVAINDLSRIRHFRPLLSGWLILVAKGNANTRCIATIVTKQQLEIL